MTFRQYMGHFGLKDRHFGREKGSPRAGTCAKSQAGWWYTASEAARANAEQNGCLAGGVRAFKQFYWPFRLEIAPEAGRKGAST